MKIGREGPPADHAGGRPEPKASDAAAPSRAANSESSFEPARAPDAPRRRDINALDKADEIYESAQSDPSKMLLLIQDLEKSTQFGTMQKVAILESAFDQLQEESGYEAHKNILKDAIVTKGATILIDAAYPPYIEGRLAQGPGLYEELSNLQSNVSLSDARKIEILKMALSQIKSANGPKDLQIKGVLTDAVQDIGRLDREIFGNQREHALGTAEKGFFGPSQELVPDKRIGAKLKGLLKSKDLTWQEKALLTDRLARNADTRGRYLARHLFMGARLAATVADPVAFEAQLKAVMSTPSSLLANDEKHDILGAAQELTQSPELKEQLSRALDSLPPYKNK